jgi:starch phosphorylase
MELKDKGIFSQLFIDRLESSRGVSVNEALPLDCYIALAKLTRDQIMKRWVQTAAHNKKNQKKQVYYFSLEFLLGKLLKRNLIALDVLDVCEETLVSLGFDPEEIYGIELDPGLGNGGLGRLAACFMDSLAFLGMPGNGCSIRYKYGLFEQKIVDGHQVELPDNWLINEAVWEIKKPGKAIPIKFYGNIREEIIGGRRVFYHENFEPVIAMPYDIPVLGYDNWNVNTLRLWSAESTQQFDYGSFSSGDYLHAVSRKYSAEAIS